MIQLKNSNTLYVLPAIHIPQSGTHNDDRLYHPDEFRKVIDVRKQLATRSSPARWPVPGMRPC